MIRITRFDGTPMMLNADWIQSVEETPDTLITLTTGEKLLVKDPLEKVVEAFHAYKKDYQQLQVTPRKREVSK